MNNMSQTDVLNVDGYALLHPPLVQVVRLSMQVEDPPLFLGLFKGKLIW